MVKFFDKWTTPNQLTISRILLIPVIYVLIAYGSRWVLVIAFFLFLIGCLTDYWDGLLARHRGESSNFGKLLDPIADKILIVSVLIILVSLGRASAFLTTIIVAREFAVSGLRSLAVTEGIVISASSVGKLKTVTQMIAVSCLILHYPVFGIPSQEIGEIFLWVAAIISIWSGIKYFTEYYKKLS